MKKSKKVLAITSAALLLLVLAFILLCRDTDNDIVYSPAPISLELRDQLEKDLLARYPECEISWYSDENLGGNGHIYGIDNGYAIFYCTFCPCLEGGETTLIDGISFAYRYYQNIYAYKDGTFIDLDQAYEQGLITRKALEKAKGYHNQCLINRGMEGSIEDSYPANIDRQCQARIVNAWRIMGNETFGTWYTEGDADADWRYYGGGILAYFGGDQTQAFTTLTIGGATFSHPTGFQIYHYNGYSIGFPLTELTVESCPEDLYDSLKNAEQKHIECNNKVFGEGWDC